MPLTLEPGCIARRKPSLGTANNARHLVVTKVFPAMGIAKCFYVRYGKRYGYKVIDVKIAELEVLLNSPERMAAEAGADPHAAGYGSGNAGTRATYFAKDPGVPEAPEVP
jgi:hypothetical protein